MVDWKKVERISVAVAIASMATLIAFVISAEIILPYSIPSIRSVVTGLGALGTLFLAWVTLKTLEQNENLIEKEKNRIENEENRVKPRIRRIGDYSVSDGIHDFLILEIDNTGNGKAINLHITPKLYCFDGDQMYSLSDYSEIDDSLPKLETRTSALVEVNKNPLSFSEKGGTLNSESSKEFNFRPDFRNTEASVFSEEYDPSEEPAIFTFETLINNGENNINRMGFTFVLKYEDVFGNEYNEKLLGNLFDPEAVDSLSDTLSNSFWNPEYEEAIRESSGD
ncbi:hypothetical protein ACOZ4N_19330 [Halorientalis pallida]|uniref:hypothetical protein n=1 Tax=Halorientalis pallida TaxID=2479928 RepID=UPI003C6F3F58